ncbi:MAG: DUF1330 domain-containing protein [Rhizomicrobium sp.]
MIYRNIMVAALVIAGFAATGARAADAPMRAYVVGEVNVTDAQTYKTYIAATTPIVAKFGGVYVARGGRSVPVEGAPPAGRIIMIQFPSLAAAQAFEGSAEYLKVAPIRQRSSTGRFFIVEGTTP